MTDNNTEQQLHYSMLCCQCGAPMEPNPTATCITCLRARINIAEGVDSEQSLLFCRKCARYCGAGDNWVMADLESAQLLGLCLKRIRGLKNCRIMNASFQWTEPHSRRIKVKLLLQTEILANITVEQEFVVTFMVQNTMCEDCQYTFTDHTWNFCVQVRQKVMHKRTFLSLEQEIVKRKTKFNIHQLGVQPDGIDFFFQSKQHANAFVAFLRSRVPGQHHSADKLVSADQKSNTAMVKKTILFEIPLVSKDDLVVVPKKLRYLIGGMSPICIVFKINQHVHLVDYITGQTVLMSSQQYWQAPFSSIRSRRNRVEAMIVNKDEFGVELQTDFETDSGSVEFSHTHHLAQVKEGDQYYVYDTTQIDWNTIPDLPQRIIPQEKYIVVSRMHNQQKMRKRAKEMREQNRFQEIDEDFKQREDDDDFIAAAEMEDDEFQGELDATEVYEDAAGFCPMDGEDAFTEEQNVVAGDQSAEQKQEEVDQPQE